MLSPVVTNPKEPRYIQNTLPVKELLGQRMCYEIDSAHSMKEVVQHP